MDSITVIKDRLTNVLDFACGSGFFLLKKRKCMGTHGVGDDADLLRKPLGEAVREEIDALNKNVEEVIEDEEDFSARESTKGKWAKLVRGFFGSRQPTARLPIIMNAGNW